MNMHKLFAIFLFFIVDQIIYAQNDSYYIGVRSFPPFTNCVENDSIRVSDLDIISASGKQNFYGYEIEIIIKILNYNNWNLSQYYLKCMNYEDIYAELQQHSILFAFGGISINSNENFSYSFQTIHSSLQFLMKNSGINYNNKNIWSFLHGFDLEIWILIIFTAILTGFLSLLFEIKRANFNLGRKCFFQMKERIWQAFASIFFSSDIQLQKISERILFLTFWFIMLILGILFISTLTIKLNFENINPKNRKELSELYNEENLQIYTFLNYDKDYFYENAWKANFTYFSRDQLGLQRLINSFLEANNNEFQKALLIDSLIAQNLASLYPCSVYLVNGNLNYFDYGIMISSSVDTKLVKNVNNALIDFQGNFLKNYLNKKYINVFPLENKCNNTQRRSSYLDNDYIGGLWVIVTGLIIFGCFIQIISNLYSKRKQNKKRKSLSLFSMNSSFEKKKKKKGFDLMVTDYIHIPDIKIIPLIQQEIKKHITSIENMVKISFYETEESSLTRIKTQEININLEKHEKKITFERDFKLDQEENEE